MDTPRLVASDIDGTLLDPMDRVTPRTLAALSRLQAAGAVFALVSGRPPRWIPPVAQAADLTGLAVCANGAIIYDIAAEKIVSHHSLTPLLLGDTVHALEKALPGIHVATERATTEGHPFATEPDFRNPWGDEPSNVQPRAEVLGHPATKLLVRHQGMTSAEMALAATEVLGTAIDVTYSTNRGLIEISAPGVTKASGLNEVAALSGVPTTATIAFGDMPNDIEMLRWATHGVAMGNAQAEVKEVADEVTASNAEDGVAVVLERWF
ncbi:Cof-type HAD-IIB family hydrolase [Actinokineospora sp. G85]|uniref:Cof-type HAD-IIB family hydrolase n=1 Tax=Actinokineospora sp. G85 TaxID=3406626 RepID=UPI003C748912